MELAIFESDASRRRLGGFGTCLVARGRGEAVAVEEEPIVEAELAFGGAGEVGTHDDLAVDVGAEDGTGGGHEEVDVFDHVDERFVLAVFDVGAAP